MRASDDYQKNPVVKRGIVVDRDPKKMRIKVRFQDEDDTVSHWIDVLSGPSGRTRSFMMPELDDEVWCGLDPKGEDGCLLGSKYNDRDKPPFDGNDDIGLIFPGGSIHVDRASGAITIRSSGTVRITASKIVLDGEVHLGGDGGQLVHRKGDLDSGGDTATGSAAKVFAV
jgi:phage baseplate assembly protein V